MKEIAIKKGELSPLTLLDQNFGSSWALRAMRERLVVHHDAFLTPTSSQLKGDRGLAAPKFRSLYGCGFQRGRNVKLKTLKHLDGARRYIPMSTKILPSRLPLAGSIGQAMASLDNSAHEMRTTDKLSLVSTSIETPECTTPKNKASC